VATIDTRPTSPTIAAGVSSRIASSITANSAASSRRYA
jgi:hypothetical protein